MIQMICVNGAPASGKSTFEEYCIDLINGSYGGKFIRADSCSTIDVVKDIAKKYGWDGVKTSEAREFLSNLKDILSSAPWGDIPLQSILMKCNWWEGELKSLGVPEAYILLFVDVREPKNIDILKTYGAKTLIVRNTNAEARPASNHADAEVLNYHYDFNVWNNGTLEDLRNTAREFISILEKE